MAAFHHKMTIQICDPIITFKGSNCSNIVPKLPKMVSSIELSAFRRHNMLVMVGKLIGIAYSTSKAKTLKNLLSCIYDSIWRGVSKEIHKFGICLEIV